MTKEMVNIFDPVLSNPLHRQNLIVVCVRKMAFPPTLQTFYDHPRNCSVNADYMKYVNHLLGFFSQSAAPGFSNKLVKGLEA